MREKIECMGCSAVGYIQVYIDTLFGSIEGGCRICPICNGQGFIDKNDTIILQEDDGEY